MIEFKKDIEAVIEVDTDEVISELYKNMTIEEVFDKWPSESEKDTLKERLIDEWQETEQ